MGMQVSRADFRRELVPDSDPDLSYLGTWSDEPAGPRSIDTGARPGRYRWFNAANAETEDDARADFERIEAYERGSWDMVGVRATVDLAIPLGVTMGDGDVYVSHTIESPGVWGIESDSDEAFLAETFDSECDVLAEMLTAMGMKVVR